MRNRAYAMSAGTPIARAIAMTMYVRRASREREPALLEHHGPVLEQELEQSFQRHSDEDALCRLYRGPTECPTLDRSCSYASARDAAGKHRRTSLTLGFSSG